MWQDDQSGSGSDPEGKPSSSTKSGDGSDSDSSLEYEPSYDPQPLADDQVVREQNEDRGEGSPDEAEAEASSDDGDGPDCEEYIPPRLIPLGHRLRTAPMMRVLRLCGWARLLQSGGHGRPWSLGWYTAMRPPTTSCCERFWLSASKGFFLFISSL